MTGWATSSGGFIAPRWMDPYPHFAPTFTVTYRVRWPWRRWWLRRHGWSTEWTVEYDRVRLADLLPRFTVSRGGVEFS